MQGRIVGRKSEDGRFYEVWQGATLLKSIPMNEATESQKLDRVIKQNKWSGL